MGPPSNIYFQLIRECEFVIISFILSLNEYDHPMRFRFANIRLTEYANFFFLILAGM